MIDAEKMQDLIDAEQLRQWTEGEKPPTWYEYEKHLREARGIKACLEGWLHIHELFDQKKREREVSA
jgi:hypothetical protein